MIESGPLWREWTPLSERTTPDQWCAQCRTRRAHTMPFLETIWHQTDEQTLTGRSSLPALLSVRYRVALYCATPTCQDRWTEDVPT